MHNYDINIYEYNNGNQNQYLPNKSVILFLESIFSIFTGHIPDDFNHRKKPTSLLRVNIPQNCFSEASGKKMSLPDVVLSCSEEQTSPKLTPQMCGRVLGHIADHFEMDRRKVGKMSGCS